MAVALVSFVAMSLPLATPASAHDSLYNPLERVFYNDGQVCVLGSAAQNHTWHTMYTEVENRCHAAAWWKKAGDIAQYQQYYKAPFWGADGTFCGEIGWNFNPTASYDFTMSYQWDIWSYFGNACNNAGINVSISIDSWQASWFGGPQWLGINNPARPFTHHCHCP